MVNQDLDQTIRIHDEMLKMRTLIFCQYLAEGVVGHSVSCNAVSVETSFVAVDFE